MDFDVFGRGGRDPDNEVHGATARDMTTVVAMHGSLIRARQWGVHVLELGQRARRELAAVAIEHAIPPRGSPGAPARSGQRRVDPRRADPPQRVAIECELNEFMGRGYGGVDRLDEIQARRLDDVARSCRRVREPVMVRLVAGQSADEHDRGSDEDPMLHGDDADAPDCASRLSTLGGQCRCPPSVVRAASSGCERGPGHGANRPNPPRVHSFTARAGPSHRAGGQCARGASDGAYDRGAGRPVGRSRRCDSNVRATDLDSMAHANRFPSFVTTSLPAIGLAFGSAACAPVGEPESPTVEAAASATPLTTTPAATPEPIPASSASPDASPTTAVHTTAPPQAGPMPQTTGFAVDFYHQVARSPGNVAFSPFSISAALAMTYGGAEGETKAEFEKVVWKGQPADSVHASYGRALSTWAAAQNDVTLRVANRLFGQRGFPFEAPFVELTRTTYGAELSPVDFRGAADQSRRTINTWVAEQTQNRIEELLYPGTVHAATRLVLVNAMYFKGDWQSPFDPQKTKTDSFATASGKRVRVPMMQGERTTSWYQDDAVTVAELPYAGDSVVMNIVLPRDGKTLAAIEAGMTAEAVAQWTTSLSPARLDIKLPRFRLAAEKSTPLRKVLEGMGLRRAFSATQAQFGGITRSEPIWIDDVIHQTFVEVNEEGTEAAAATATTMRVYAIVETHAFHVDRPFLFFIRDKRADQLLFVGRVDDPS